MDGLATYTYFDVFITAIMEGSKFALYAIEFVMGIALFALVVAGIVELFKLLKGNYNARS